MTTRSRPPVALFVYARPRHSYETLRALADNEGADETDVFVFADGQKSAEDRERVKETRAVVADARGFRSIAIVARETNVGLAANIVGGVSEILQKSQTVIVVEDDIVTAPGFLNFMEASLRTYAEDPRVWHVSGWNYPIDPQGLADAFFYRAMNCWGWATWAERWRHYERDLARIAARFDRSLRRQFNLDGKHDFYRQVVDNLDGKRRTWAIFWYATIFLEGGLCLNPATSFVQNIGLDGSGENCGNLEGPVPLNSKRRDFALPDQVTENEAALARIKQALSQGPAGSLRLKLAELVRG